MYDINLSWVVRPISNQLHEKDKKKLEQFAYVFKLPTINKYSLSPLNMLGPVYKTQC